jgi:trk system potassium uptake protein TrkA
MNVAIIGLGRFGQSLARRLYELKHKVSVIDQDPKAVASLQSICEQAVAADATDRSVLEEMGIGLVDVAIVALGHDLGASIMVTLIVKEMGVKTVVCKAVTAEHERILKRLGADEVIFPERDAARRLALSLAQPDLLDYLPLGQGFSVMELAPPPNMVGRTIQDLDLRRRYGVNIIAIREIIPERTRVIIEPDFVVKDSDIMVVLGSQENLAKLRGTKLPEA